MCSHFADHELPAEWRPQHSIRSANHAKITTIGAGTAVAIFYPKFRTPEWRPLRASMFVAMGLSAVFPVLHGLRLYGYKQLESQIGLSWLISQGMLYIAGASIYEIGRAHV